MSTKEIIIQNPLGKIKSAGKGRVVQERAANGFKAPKKAVLPIGDLVMPSGRVLVYSGIERVHAPGNANFWQDLSIWRADSLRVMASIDPDRSFRRLLHLSISYADHYPTWEELLEIRYTFYPTTIDVMMILPKDGAYVNIMEYCFQMRECPTAWSE